MGLADRVSQDPSGLSSRFRVVDEQDRLRPHVRFFVNGEQARDLTHPLAESDDVVIVPALSAG